LRVLQCEQKHILFKLTNCQTRSFRSYFQRLCRHPNQVLQLFNFVVSRFHLNGNFFLDLDQIHFSLGKQCPRVVDLGVVLSPIEEVVRESESKDSKVVNEERNSTLITVSSQPGDVGDICVLYRRVRSSDRISATFVSEQPAWRQVERHGFQERLHPGLFLFPPGQRFPWP
jgi:hypothetical protein